ncbi:hypothetical protein BX265_8582 [Streptomyces sp. TLI_235]|nr:hypothetical protein [Streptomyces sp. TLI_235]PBC66094.1 hypothetical protein BX265_8582 [Streptomyces sp. TLI_235]
MTDTALLRMHLEGRAVLLTDGTMVATDRPVGPTEEAVVAIPSVENPVSIGYLRIIMRSDPATPAVVDHLVAPRLVRRQGAAAVRPRCCSSSSRCSPSPPL